MHYIMIIIVVTKNRISPSTLSNNLQMSYFPLAAASCNGVNFHKSTALTLALYYTRSHDVQSHDSHVTCLPSQGVPLPRSGHRNRHCVMVQDP